MAMIVNYAGSIGLHVILDNHRSTAGNSAQESGLWYTSAYRQVDGGKLSVMSNSKVDAPHKEAWVYVSNWSWRGTGPYVVNFVAKNNAGAVIGQKAVTIYIAQ
jgi:hypothetical protein